LSADQTPGGVTNLCGCASNDGYGFVAMNVHPEQNHHWQKVTQVKRRSSWINARVNTNTFVGEQLVEGTAIASQVLYETTLFQYSQQALGLAST
jgi:hypothetical protein